MAKRRASAFAKRVGAGIRSGLTFKQAVQRAKGSKESGKVKIGRVRRSAQRIMPRRRRFRRRGTASTRGRRRAGITAWRVIKGLAIFGPPAATSYGVWQQTHNASQVASHVGAMYTGYDFASNTFPRTDKLIIGYGGPLAIWVAGKTGISRLFRV